MYLIDALKHTCINIMYFSSINMHLQMKFNKSITFLKEIIENRKFTGHSYSIFIVQKEIGEKTKKSSDIS